MGVLHCSKCITAPSCGPQHREAEAQHRVYLSMVPDADSLFLSPCRWRLSHMSWMTSCVMNVKGPVVGGNLLHFSVLMLPVCSITVNIAGLLFTLVLAESSTSPW